MSHVLCMPLNTVVVGDPVDDIGTGEVKLRRYGCCVQGKNPCNVRYMVHTPKVLGMHVPYKHAL